MTRGRLDGDGDGDGLALLCEGDGETDADRVVRLPAKEASLGRPAELT